MTTEEHKPQTNQALLVRLVQDMAEVKAQLKVVADHENRIRELEKARYSSAWITSILSAGLSSAIVYFIIKTIGG